MCCYVLFFLLLEMADFANAGSESGAVLIERLSLKYGLCGSSAAHRVQIHCFC